MLERLRVLMARTAALFSRRRVNDEFTDELETHLALLVEDNVRRGQSPEQAARNARLELGEVTQLRETNRELHGFPWIETVFQDLRYALRGLRKSLAFSIVVVITLALGTGATTAIFSVVNAVLLRPLQYGDPGRLVTILHNGNNPVAVANYIDWRDTAKSFEAMGAADYWGVNISGKGQPERLLGLKVTQNLLPILGVEPMLGRLFLPGEDQEGAEHEVILSYRLWQRAFGGDRGLLGRTITLNGEAYTVVGIMPPQFKFAPFWATQAQLWVPNAFGTRVQQRDGNSLRVFARLKAGVTLEQARAEIGTITARLEQQYPGTNRHVVVTPLIENVVGKVRTPLLILLAAVFFVLLIACANVAHMLLARTASRQKEIAVRAALGARRLRVVRQFLTESLLLAGIGSAGGLLLAMWGTRALVALRPGVPRLDTIAVDARAVLFTLGLTVLTGIAFGIAPAIQASAVNLIDVLKDGGRSGSDSVRRNRMRSVLVASEFALALMLLIAAGLMVRSFFALQSIDPGWSPRGVLSLVVSVAGTPEEPPAQRELLYRQMLERASTLPGVESAGAVNHVPLIGDLWGWPFSIEGRPKSRPGESPWGVYRIVMPGYFATMRWPLLRGRDVTLQDAGGSPGVVLINETAARRWWPAEDPIGKRINFVDEKTGPPNWLTVIGVVKDGRQGDWSQAAQPEVFLAALQNKEFLGERGSHASYITLVVRTAGDPAAMAPAVKNAVWSLDPNLPISEVTTMTAAVALDNEQPRFQMLLMGIFAGVALVLAAVGIYGLMNYSVARRTHEIGIRMSLGASRGDVLRMVLRQAMTLALVGSAAGLVSALLLARLLTGLLFGVRPTDPATFIVVAVSLAAVALIASYLPARRATKIDPMVALRYE